MERCRDLPALFVIEMIVSLARVRWRRLPRRAMFVLGPPSGTIGLHLVGIEDLGIESNIFDLFYGRFGEELL
jgi:hypothetical protein